MEPEPEPEPEPELEEEPPPEEEPPEEPPEEEEEPPTPLPRPISMVEPESLESELDIWFVFTLVWRICVRL